MNKPTQEELKKAFFAVALPLATESHAILDNRIFVLQQRTDLTPTQKQTLHTADVCYLQDNDNEAERLITALEKELGVFNV